jgi:osmotically-inducible protein OsmY
VWIVQVDHGVVMMQPQTSGSDESLRESILAIFTADHHAAQMDIRIGVLNGIVHLAGKVASLTERATVEELASRVSGVRGVVNRIEAPGAPSPARTINLDLELPK